MITPVLDKPIYCQVAGPSILPDYGPPIRLAAPPLDLIRNGELPRNVLDVYISILAQRRPLAAVTCSSCISKLPKGIPLEVPFPHDLLSVPEPMRTRLRDWTGNLLDRLVRERKLHAEALAQREEITHYILKQYHLQVAQALEMYLSGSGEYRYTLDQELKDRSIDPVEDFLYNTKAGNCERYASALVLMLRTQGIPAQLVRGYRGCESKGNGWYEIRQDEAHAWADVLIPRPASAADLPSREAYKYDLSGIPVYHFVSMDPTPGTDMLEQAAADEANWFELARRVGSHFSGR